VLSFDRGGFYTEIVLWILIAFIDYKHSLSFSTPMAIELATVVGIEPTSTGLESVILPLNYTELDIRVGFEPTLMDLQSNA
jgi:hypothetical protein